MISYEQIVKDARDAVGGIHRPEDECSTEGMVDRGQPSHRCPLAVTSPASHDIPTWVIEAMKVAYQRGLDDAQRGSAALDPRAE